MLLNIKIFLFLGIVLLTLLLINLEQLWEKQN